MEFPDEDDEFEFSQEEESFIPPPEIVGDMMLSITESEEPVQTRMVNNRTGFFVESIFIPRFDIIIEIYRGKEEPLY